MNEHMFHEGDPLDDLIRQSLSGMEPEPSKGVWQRLSRRLLRSELLRFHFSNLPRSLWGVVIPATVVITGVILYYTAGEQQTIPTPGARPEPQQVLTPAGPAAKPSPDGAAAIGATTPLTTSYGLQPAVDSPTPVAEPTSVISTVQPEAPSGLAETRITAPVNPTGQAAEPAPPVTAYPMLPSDPAIARDESIPFLMSLPPEQPLAGIYETPAIRPVDNPLPQETFDTPPATPLKQSLDMGINVTPDMVFFRDAAGSFKYNYTFDLGARYNLGRFYFQSGAGMTYSTDIGDYAISYLKNDSVGFYYTINSFSIDPGGNPIFNVKEVTVYDSVQYFYDYSTKNRYYYLQIPLSAGYRIVDRPSWRLSVEAGLLYAYLFSLKEPVPVFYVPEGRILSIERRTPERNRHSLGITGGINVEYQFARNFFLLIEPTFKYYLQAIEENSSRGDRQPYSIGLRAGIWYRLNVKNRTR